MNLSDKEKIVIASIQGDIPIAEKPYEILAEKAGFSEEEFINILKSLNDKGIIRRFGATLKHQKSGFSANAMVAWNADEETISETGRKMAKSSSVSHCYRRSPKDDWKLNLYTMIHAKDEEDCINKVHELSEISGISEFEILFSQRELKKTSMKYFSESPRSFMEDEDD